MYYQPKQTSCWFAGPFTSSEMAEWFSAGYFTMNLQVRRGCDEKFSPLGKAYWLYVFNNAWKYPGYY